MRAKAGIAWLTVGRAKTSSREMHHRPYLVLTEQVFIKAPLTRLDLPGRLRILNRYTRILIITTVPSYYWCVGAEPVIYITRVFNALLQLHLCWVVCPALANTRKLADVKAEDFDTVFYPGGHGPMWDLAESPVSKALIESFYNSGKPVALVCHAPGVLRHVTYQGKPLVKGKHVSGFTNGEEEEMKLTHVVPFLVEDELMRLGAI
jgi:hypothetical protein